MDEKDNKRKIDSSGISIGLNMAVGISVFTLLGVWADQKLNSNPLGLITGIILGLFYCGYEIWKLIKRS